MLQELTVAGSGNLIRYSPDKGLKTIAAATAAERYWKQAKDSHQLLLAIRAKLTAQAQYVIWRDSVLVPSRQNGAPGRGKRISNRQSVLPDADPGHVVAHRWRKRLCSKTTTGTKIDHQKLDQELKNILSRCVSVTEFEHDDKYDMTPHDEQILKQAKEIRRRQYADKHAKRIKNLIKISRGNGPLPTDQKYPVILC